MRGLGIIFETIRFALARMTDRDFFMLGLFLALMGWLGWRGYAMRKWVSHDVSNWMERMSGDSENTPLWLRVMGLTFYLLLLAMFALFLIGN